MSTSVRRAGRMLHGARWWLGALVLLAALAVGVRRLEPGRLADALAAALGDPAGLGLAAVAFLAAFALRAWAWTRLLPGLGFGHALAGILVAFGANHVLPLRLGEPLRVTSVVRRAGVGLAEATASTVGLRAADLAALGLGVALLAPRLARGLVGDAGLLLAVPAVAAWVVAALWLRRRQGAVTPTTHVLVGVCAALAWCLEAVLVQRAAGWAGVELDLAGALLVTLVAVAAQVVAVAPAGVGTYEAAATAAMVALGVPAAPALAAAVTMHAAKTLLSLILGLCGVLVPAPTLLGRLRMPRSEGSLPSGPPARPDAPVTLFLPAHDEEASVADVVARAPRQVHGRSVRVVVVDDGSTDRTAARARAAGAEVLSMGTNAGLGAAVRAGLADAVRAGSAAVAFCDADGEYAPEELADVVGPILDGAADYVVGTRFTGAERMRPHRRLGNHVLTALLRLIARLPLTDGQSGYRALSPAAATAAEVVHDYNYAQVLTLDLVGKGARYAEVPISYAFRTAGRSFVRLPTYLRRVLPAVHRELNAQSSTTCSRKPASAALQRSVSTPPA